MARTNRLAIGSASRGVTVSGAVLLLAGGLAVGVAAASQEHAPQPTAQVAGTTGPASTAGAGGDAVRSAEPATGPNPKVVGPTLPASRPVSIDIPAIQVASKLQDLGVAPTGTIQVPQPGPAYNEAAWFDASPTPGEIGPSVIEGHIDSAATGPSVFFDLGALEPGDPVNVTLADGIVAVFTVTGVREYPKSSFPTTAVYGNTDFAALRLITCGGAFDSTTGHYLSNTVVYASLTSAYPVTSTGSP
ncbi:MAG: class F sortase [Actinomycetota bacterium]|jgi:hypothetical protein|nr:class F sortase [Actinomycetota bacterium]